MRKAEDTFYFGDIFPVTEEKLFASHEREEQESNNKGSCDHMG